jgi:glycosyltransferase involved in cell wall biosynthesis
MTRRTACIIPALDAAETLPLVIGGLRAALPAALLIGVNDGSRDRTGEVLAAVADETITFPVNRGKGAALRAGFRLARERGCAEVVTIDADGQHDPSYVPLLLDALADADLVIGARARRGTSMPFQRRLSNCLATAAVRVVSRCRVEDAQSGFRAMRIAVLDAVDPPGDRYEFETELLIAAGRAGFRIMAVHVPTIYRGGRSHFAGVRDTVRIARAIWRHRAGAFA